MSPGAGDRIALAQAQTVATGAAAKGRASVGALASVFFTLGVLATGAVAVGAVAIRAAAHRQRRIRKLRIDELDVGMSSRHDDDEQPTA